MPSSARINISSSFSTLPTELIEQILCFLEGKDIIVFQMVSRRILHLVQNSARLQYTIELFVGRMEDGNVATHSIYDRLADLRAFRTGWHEAKWTTNLVVNWVSSNFSGWNSGDVITDLVDQGRSLAFVQIPSCSRRIAQNTWKVEGVSDEGPINWHHDDMQDLLVVHEKFNDDTILMHLRTSSGKYHPQATQPTLSVPCTAPVNAVTSTITSSLLALFSSTTRNHLWVWDWRQAKLLFDVCVSFPEFHLHTVDFLDERYIVIAGRGEEVSPGTLLVLNCYTIPPGAIIDSFDDLLRYSTLVLDLPPLAENVVWSGFIRVASSGYYGKPHEISPLYRDCVFFSSSNSRFLLVEATTRSLLPMWIGEEEHDHVIIVPIPALLSRIAALSSLPARCPWDAWAQDTRYLTGDFIFDDTDLCMSRFAARRKRAIPGQHDEEVLVILEFDSPFAIRRDLASGDPAKISSIVMAPTSADSRFFQSTAATAVSYREILTDIVIPEGYSIYLGEHSVVLAGRNMRVLSL